MSLTPLLASLRSLFRPRRPRPNPPLPPPPPGPEPFGFTRRLVETHAWGDDDLFLVDVGASGGIHSRWQVYRPLLRALGFEPLVHEVERLNSTEPDAKVRYVAAFVGCQGYDQLFPPQLRDHRPGESIWKSPTYRRTSAARALTLLGIDYAREKYNAAVETVYSGQRVQLDEALAGEYGAVDFIKVDTDGHDYEVLLGAERLLREGRVLGLSVEVQLHGPAHDHANVFCNIDRFLRGLGFALFDLEVYRYTRGVLPGRFQYTIPAQTTTGQVIWGEALYLRDLAAADAARGWPPAKVLKLASLMEVFGLPDCAAELLAHARSQLPGRDVAGDLDLLAAAVAGRLVTFEQYNRDWEEYARQTLR